MLPPSPEMPHRGAFPAPASFLARLWLACLPRPASYLSGVRIMRALRARPPAARAAAFGSPATGNAPLSAFWLRQAFGGISLFCPRFSAIYKGFPL